LQSFFPWWSLVVAAFACGYFMPLRLRIHSLWAGFIAGFLLWSVYALYLNMTNDGLLTTKIGDLLGGVPALSLPVLSGLFAGILSGMGALSGRLGKGLLERKPEENRQIKNA